MQLYLFAFACTLVIELAVLAALAPAPLRARALLAALAANLITHPVAFALAPEVGWAPTELLVLGAESWLFAALGLGRFPRAFAWSLAANVASASGALWFPA